MGVTTPAFPKATARAARGAATFRREETEATGAGVFLGGAGSTFDGAASTAGRMASRRRGAVWCGADFAGTGAGAVTNE